MLIYNKRGKNKSGLSPVIATVLLIVLVLILIIIIFLWARTFVSEQVEKFGNPISDYCDDLNFALSLNKHSSGGLYRLDIVNQGNIPIYEIDIKQVRGGDSNVTSYTIKVKAGESGILDNLALNSFNPTEKVIISPGILGNVKGKTLNKVYVCLDKAKEISL